jgi:hypothetical protein
VFAALRYEGVSRSDVARELRIPFEELNRAAFGLAVARDSATGRRQPSEPPASGRPDLRVVV